MKIPNATYRIQFTPSFRFADAGAIARYLSDLGVSTLYSSPLFCPRPGSVHGYDIVDPTRFNPELGGESEFIRMNESLRTLKIGWLQDIVPNHMAYDGKNALITDVLEKGAASRYKDFFDIDWLHPYEAIRGRVLAPFLGKYYGDALEGGEIRLGYDQEGLSMNYYEFRFPLKIESYVRVLSHNISGLKRVIGEDHPDLIQLLGLLYTLKELPPEEEGNQLYRHIAFAKRMLWELYSGNADIRRFIDETIVSFNGKKGVPESFTLLDKLHKEQLFRLSFWKVASEELNYRRFFSINDLISLHAENREVFAYTHALVFRLLREERITALRVDHIDGLYDPLRYLRSLRERAPDIYLIVEKILAADEDLPPDWPVQGTTGYDFLNQVNEVFIDTAGEFKFDRIYQRFIGYQARFDTLIFDKKRLIIGKYMAGDIDSLALMMKKYSVRDRKGIDITMYGLKRALVDVLALFPIYRTYINAEVFSERDRMVIQGVIARAKEINPGLENELEFIRNFLLLEYKDYFDADEKKQWLHFVMRFQQYSGPLMAKGLEDTALYVFNRFLSLNEVGGDPSRFGSTVGQLHAFLSRRRDNWPHTMNTLSTHDTKRGEDARARLNVLSELPDEWRRNVRAWSWMNRAKKRTVNGREIPVRNDEYFFYQALVGAFPFYEDEYPGFVSRIQEYLVKAVREAKIYTAWLKPDEEYEKAFKEFAGLVLSLSPDNPFLASFIPFQKRVSHYAVFNSLSQTLIKMTAPGVPDLYQGTELWDFSMVDPDNRRPVDFTRRREYLSSITGREREDLTGLIRDLLVHKENGQVKLFLIYRALNSRKDLTDTFTYGDYLPLEVNGRFKDHILAFARRHKDSWAVTAVPRFLTRLIKEGELPLGTSVWGNTEVILPPEAPRHFRDCISGRTFEPGAGLPAGELFALFPGAFLRSLPGQA